MPYQNEFAHHKILGRFTESEEVKTLLENCIEPELEDFECQWLKVTRDGWSPRDVLAIDGSHVEIPYERGYPGAELSFISVANVLINVEKLKEESGRKSIDPVEFNKIQSALNVVAALPGSNLVIRNYPDARSSFRAALYNLLKNTRPGTNSETLLETYEVLLKVRGSSRGIKCPLQNLCPKSDGNEIYASSSVCSCGSYSVYSTDLLRIQERFNDSSGNGESFGEVMRVMEHLLLVATVRHMEKICSKEGNWDLFLKTAIVMDGSLAVFGDPAWLGQAIKKELSRINEIVKSNTGKEMLIFGIEKTGKFFEHLCRLDTRRTRGSPNESSADEKNQVGDFAPSQGRMPTQSVILLDDAYIKTHIIHSEGGKPHGKDTYYGRPFLYKTSTGAMIVGISAILSEEHDDRSKAGIEQYPRLGDILDLLDLLVSMRYPNAIIPLIAAHAEAAIPLQMGEKVLDKLARDHISKSKP